METSRKHIALYMPNGPAYYADVYHGITTYCRGHHQWSFVTWPRAAVWTIDEMLYDLTLNQVDGAIGMGDSFWETHPLARRVAFVDIEYKLTQFKLPRIGVDEAAVGRLAAEHFRERGYRHLAAVGINALPSRERIAAFNNAAAEWCDNPVAYFPLYDPASDLSEWLRNLPRPSAVFCWNDEAARTVYHNCRRIDINIPRDIAILGVDNDIALCESTDPPLSSVDPNSRALGYEAAALLDRMLKGEPPPTQPILVRPIGVVTRDTTDLLSVRSPMLTKALRFIRENAAQGLRVEDVLDHLAVSRSTLEKQFHKALGRSPRSEIYRVLIERARDLLANTNLMIPTIAARCGYQSANHFTTMFRKQTGETPTAYRRRVLLTG